MRGEIRNEDAYIQGKMWDGSAWQTTEPHLPRNITPCDIDLVFDNAGRVLACELTRNYSVWRDLDAGQYRVYQSFVRCSEHCAVLCRHSVPIGQRICTRADIESFQVLFHAEDSFYQTNLFEGNDRWQRFIAAWFEDAGKVRRQLLAIEVREEQQRARIAAANFDPQQLVLSAEQLHQIQNPRYHNNHRCHCGKYGTFGRWGAGPISQIEWRCMEHDQP